jgi:uncharacterized protein (DUF305 family)
VAALLLVAGCSPQPATGAAGAGPTRSGPTGFGATDVMFAQMALEQNREGDQVAALVAARAGDPRVRQIAATLRARRHDDSGTLQRWLLGWQQPLTADPSAGMPAGHGDLHALQPDDLTSLRAARGAAADRTAVALLLSGLHNSVETTRMESLDGTYPPARHLADEMTAAYQDQIRTLLIIAAGR